MKTFIKVALIALLWIIVINPGRIYGDTNTRLQMAHAWWTGTEEVTLKSDYKPTSRLDSSIGIIGTGGKRYIPYDVGQSLLMLPGDWLGTQMHKLLPQQNEFYLRRMVVNWLVFVPLNVAAIVSCFWLLRLLGFEERISKLASIVLLLGTTVLHYAQQTQQNNQILLFVTLGYATALAYLRGGYSWLAILSGLTLGSALLIRQTSIIHILTVFLFLVVGIVYQSRDTVKVVKVAGLWILGLIPLVLAGRIFDYIRFGVFWKTGASLVGERLNQDPLFSNLPPLPENYPFINPAHVGIWGVIFSPAKSIFIYDPLLLPCLVIGVFFWKKLSPYIQLYLISVIFNLGLHIALYSKLDFWHGDAAWGARYHVTSVHLILIPLIAVFLQYLLSAKRTIRWLIAVILSLAMMVQIASVILRPSAETGRIYFAQPSSFLEFRLGKRLTNIGCLINSSFSVECPSKLKSTMYEPLINKVSLLPFNFTNSRYLVLGFWMLLVIIAFVATLLETSRFFRI